MKNLSGVVMIALALIMSTPLWAEEGAIPNEYHGMWAVGVCSAPKYHLHIEASGIQGYGPDKRTPVRN